MERKVKHLPKDLTNFTANGREYIFQPEPPISRFKEFMRLRNLLGFSGKDDKELTADFEKIYQSVNGNQLDRNMILTLCRNNIDGIKHNLTSLYPAVFQIAALFINRKDEDPTTFNKALNNDKIADWEAEGFAAADFFSLAASLVTGFKNRLLRDFPNALGDNEAENSDAPSS